MCSFNLILASDVWFEYICDLTCNIKVSIPGREKIQGLKRRMDTYGWVSIKRSQSKQAFLQTVSSVKPQGRFCNRS